MKSYQEYINEFVAPIMSGRAGKQSVLVFDGDHSKERAVEREVPWDIIKSVLDKGIKWIGKNKEDLANSENAKKENALLFYSKSDKQGVVVSYTKTINGKKYMNKNIKIITVLPSGRSFPKEGTKKVVVENVNYEYDRLVELD